nr:LysM peptidoglycan-binding domain-containing protein [Eubacterium sp.]
MNRRYCNGMVHVIRQGETLYQLSRKYRVPLALLLRANPYVDVYNLQVGQEICIPMVRPNGMICVPAQDMMPRQEEEQRMEETIEEAPCCEMDEMEIRRMDEEDDDDVEIYVTSGGRSLGDILNEYGVKWEDFVKKNNLSQVVIGDDVVLYFPKRKKS